MFIGEEISNKSVILSQNCLRLYHKIHKFRCSEGHKSKNDQTGLYLVVFCGKQGER